MKLFFQYVSRFVIVKTMTNRYQDFSYNYTHNLYKRNIKYTIKRHRQSNKKAHTYSIVSGQFWQSARHVVARKIVECDGRVQLFKLRIIYSAMYHLAQDVHNLENRPHATGRQFQTVTTVL